MGDVGFFVAGGPEDGVETDFFTAVIKGYRQDGDVGAQSDVVKAAVPLFGLAARAFGGDAQQELVVLVEGVDHAADHAVSGAAVDGDAAQPMP